MDDAHAYADTVQRSAESAVRVCVFGGRVFLHNLVVHVTHLPIPLQETGAFNLFAWQGVWVIGLWLGARSMEGEMPLARVPGWAVAVCGAVCTFFFEVRHGWLGPHLTQQSL